MSIKWRKVYDLYMKLGFVEAATSLTYRDSLIRRHRQPQELLTKLQQFEKEQS